MAVEALNHAVLLVADVEGSIRFYEDALGMWAVRRGAIVSMHFQGGALVLIQDAEATSPGPTRSTRGSADLGLVLSGTPEDCRSKLEQTGVKVLAGPIKRLASDGPVHSLFVRDPDGNLLELAFSARA